MRKITSRKTAAKKAKRNQLLLGVFLIIIMFFSVVGYGFGGKIEENNSDKVEYNDYEFILQNGFWILNFQDVDFVFRYNPKQINRVNAEVNIINGYSQKPLYIYSEDINAKYEITVNLNRLVQRVQNACLSKKECEGTDYPIKTCEDNFIIIKEGNISKITQDNNCVFIEGKSEDLVKLADDFLLKILGI